MWEHRDNNQKEPEKLEGDFRSHKLSTMRLEETASSLQVSEAARPESQSPLITVTAAAQQPRDVSQTPPSTRGSEHTLITDSPVVMVSPFRIYEEDCFPLFFSKDVLIDMDHNKHHLEIDLFRPEGEANFPPQDLSPLCLFRQLRSLKITGMMQSYQSYIWLVVWLNPQLTDLTLEMEGEAEAEPLGMKAIAEAQKYAECKPTMQEVVQGKAKTKVPEKF